MRNAFAVAISILVARVALAQSQTDVRIASDGQQFLAVWREDETRLVANRVAATGAMIGSPTLVATTSYQHGIAFGSSAYLVVWSSGGLLMARRVAPGGTLLDSTPAVITYEKAKEPAIVWTGKAWFVVWTVREDAGGGGVFGAFVSTDGAVSDARQIFRGDRTSGAILPHVAWNGTNFLVTWAQFQACDAPCSSGPHGVYGVRVAPDGSPIDTSPFGAVSNSPSTTHSLASDGNDFFVTYDRDYGLGASRVFPIPSPRGETSRLYNLFNWFSAPATATDVIWDGQVYEVASRYSTTIQSLPVPAVRRQWLALTCVGADGGVLSRDVVALARNGPIDPPAVATNTAGDAVIAMTERADDGSQRVRIHTRSEMHRSAQPPAPPRALGAVSSGSTTHLTWSADDAMIDGFLIEKWHFHYGVWLTPLQVAVADARSADLPGYIEVNWYNSSEGLIVRAFNEGGVSSSFNVVHVTLASRRRGVKH